MTLSAADARRQPGPCRVVPCTALFLVWAALPGCELIPPNNFRLIAARPAGDHPTLVHFDKGAFLGDPNGGVVLLAGRNAAALFDFRGPSNRFELLFTEGRDRAFYDRIGRYGPLTNPRSDTTPVGIRSVAEARRLRGTVDVFVARSELRDADTSFEHFPREMRVVGYFVVPAAEASAGGGHPLADLMAADNSGGRPGFADLRTLEPETGESRLTPIAARLPALPLIDMQYLVPTTLLSAFRPQAP